MPPSASESPSTTIGPSEPILYQVDCCVASSGKTVSASKRRIRWRYGFANPQALDNGAVGVEARGSEHEVTLVWSITSGKKKVIHDGKEIHYSQGRRAEGKFQFSWHANNHVYHVIAYASPAMAKSKTGSQSKQFELLIDGCSFGKLTRIFELGTFQSFRSRGEMTSTTSTSFAMKGGRDQRVVHVPRSVHTGAGAFMPIERRNEQEQVHWSRSEHSLESVRRMNSESPQSVRSNAASPPLPPYDLLSEQHTIADASAVTDLLSASTPFDIQEQSHAHSHNSSNPFEYDENDEFNPTNPPTHEIVWHNIMSAYDCPDQGSITTTSTSTHNTHAGHHSQFVTQPTTVEVKEVDASLQNLMIDTSRGGVKAAGLSVHPMESPTDVTVMDSVNKLVNLDDISAPVLRAYTPTSCENSMAKRQHLSLRDLKSEISKAPSTKEIMKTHGNVAHAPQQQSAGQLVVYGSASGQSMYNNYGPPPLSHGAFK